MRFAIVVTLLVGACGPIPEPATPAQQQSEDGVVGYTHALCETLYPDQMVFPGHEPLSATEIAKLREQCASQALSLRQLVENPPDDL